MIPKHAQPYWVFVQEAAKRYGFEGHTYEFAGILDRESFFGEFLAPKGPEGLGDHGHGHGLGQIDDRTHAQFLSQTDADGNPLWKKAQENIEESARIFASGLWQMHDQGDARIIAAIAAFNAGATKVRVTLDDLTQPASYEAKLEALDAITTDGEAGPYVSDVLSRAARFMVATNPPQEGSAA